MNPQQTLESAVYEHLSVYTFADILGIYKGLDNETIADDESQGAPRRLHPSITILADGNHEEVLRGTKVFRGALKIHVEADAMNTTDANFATICEGVFAKFDLVGLSGILSAYDGFTCLSAHITDTGRMISDSVNWVNEITLDCVYAEANL